MVNEFQVRRAVRDRIEVRPVPIAARGGLSRIKALARRTRPWSDRE